MKTLCMLDNAPATLLCQIPPAILTGIQNYVLYGHSTGDFLYAVLSNDLFGAIGRADEDSLAAIKYIIQYLNGYIPASVHGSWDNVKRHLQKGRELRDMEDKS